MLWLLRLLDLVFPPRTHETIVRTMTPDVLFTYVAPITINSTRPSITALLPFHAPPVRALIHEAKYHGNKRAQTLLATVLAAYLHNLPIESFTLVPVPLSSSRYKERGFNQCERICSHAAAKLTRIPDIDTTLLVRTKHTEHQTLLNREERIKNMHDAFSVTTPPDPSMTYVLIDDVITTGATLQAGIDALTAAGAQSIIPIAIARAHDKVLLYTS